MYRKPHNKVETAFWRSRRESPTDETIPNLWEKIMDTKYNGWTNYATWRVNLEIFDGIDPREYWIDLTDVYELSKTLKAYAEEMIDQSGAHGIAVDYALAFLSDVDWYSIARHMADDYELFTNETERAQC